MTGPVLLVCRSATPGAEEAPWHLVFERAARAVRVVELTAAAADEWPRARRSVDGASVVLGIGDAADAAYRLASRTPTAFRLIVADARVQPSDTRDGLGVPEVPITAISSDPPRAAATGALLGWASRTVGAFEIRTLPPWRVAPDAFVTGCLRHLHEAGLLSGPDDRGDVLALRP